MLLADAKTELPERVEPHTTRLALFPRGNPEDNPHSMAFLLNHVAADELLRTRKDNPHRGQPTMYALTNGGDASVLHLWPAPDKKYYATFRYCPAMKEI